MFQLKQGGKYILPLPFVFGALMDWVMTTCVGEGCLYPSTHQYEHLLKKLLHKLTTCNLSSLQIVPLIPHLSAPNLGLP